MSVAIENSESVDNFTFKYSAGLHSAFEEFLKALEYADDLDRNAWEFAVDLPRLRRLNLSNNDLRWLVGAELVSYAVETSSSADAERSFRRPPRLMFCKKTCFVLTPKGIALGRTLVNNGTGCDPCIKFQALADHDHSVADSAGRPPAPTWDRVQQELRVGAVVIKRFRVPAASQETILAAFEEEAWPPRIDDPLPPRGDQSPKRRLQETIKSLNRNQKQPLIRFFGDGNARGVLWKFCGLHSATAASM
jgi:hypothetical protein